MPTDHTVRSFVCALPNCVGNHSRRFVNNPHSCLPASPTVVDVLAVHEIGVIQNANLFDQFATWDIERDILVGANRGASGIDGLVASAVGFAIGSRRPTTVVIGDLAFLHDVNSLQLVRQSPVPINVVVINNNGGGIFHFLPIADGPGDFERLFAMPHGLKDFSHAAAQFAIEYHSARTMPEFRREYQSMLESGGSHIIELQTDRVRNAEYHRWLRTEIKAREFGATE